LIFLVLPVWARAPVHSSAAAASRAIRGVWVVKRFSSGGSWTRGIGESPFALMHMDILSTLEKLSK
jgi:hypothetical protein